jgi:hypothetical protein
MQPLNGEARPLDPVTLPDPVTLLDRVTLLDEALYQERPGTPRTGDCVAPRTVHEAVLEGRRAGLAIGAEGDCMAGRVSAMAIVST